MSTPARVVCLSDTAGVVLTRCLAQVKDLQAGTSHCIYRQCRNKRKFEKWCDVHHSLLLVLRAESENKEASWTEWKGPIAGLQQAAFRLAPIPARLKFLTTWNVSAEAKRKKMAETELEGASGIPAFSAPPPLVLGTKVAEELKRRSIVRPPAASLPRESKRTPAKSAPPAPKKASVSRRESKTLKRESLTRDRRITELASLPVGSIVCGYVIDRLLGQGAYGVVYAVYKYDPAAEGLLELEQKERKEERGRSSPEEAPTGKLWAMKLIPTSLSDGELDAAMIIEGTIYGSLRHPNLMSAEVLRVDCPPFEETSTDPRVRPVVPEDRPKLERERGRELPRGTLAIVMPFGTPLDDFLKDLPLDAPNAVNFRFQIIYDLICGLKHLWNAGFAHRDLKPENVLIVPIEDHAEQKRLSRTWMTKITDFGLAKRFLAPQTREIQGTVAYMAPELLLLYVTGNVNPPVVGVQELVASDIWSLGLLCFYIMLLSYIKTDDKELRQLETTPLLSPEDVEALASDQIEEEAEPFLLLANAVSIARPPLSELKKIPAAVTAQQKLLEGRSTYDRIHALSGLSQKDPETGVMFNNMLRWRPLDRTVAWPFDRYDSEIVKHCEPREPVPELKDFRASLCRESSEDKDGGKPLCSDYPFSAEPALPYALVAMANDIYYMYTCALPTHKEELAEEDQSEMERMLASIILAAKEYDAERLPEVARWVERVSKGVKLSGDLNRRIQRLVAKILKTIRWRPGALPFYCSRRLTTWQEKEYASAESKKEEVKTPTAKRNKYVTTKPPHYNLRPRRKATKAKS